MMMLPMLLLSLIFILAKTFSIPPKQTSAYVEAVSALDGSTAGLPSLNKIGIPVSDSALDSASLINYFQAYAYITEQKKMLSDRVRMDAYHSAIMKNADAFKDKVVLDIGTGSGILSIWAAKAGAKKVYAVEYTDMAIFARKLVAENGVAGVVEVIQTSVEDLELPGQVDIVISEWQGLLLLRESMLDSVIKARDKFLRPGGLMFPSHATIYVGAVSDEEDRKEVVESYKKAQSTWSEFALNMKYYDVDVNSLEGDFDKENIDYYLYTALWRELSQSSIIGEPQQLIVLDLHEVSLEEAKGLPSTEFSILVPHLARDADGKVFKQPTVKLSALAGWFTVDFRGSKQRPLAMPITLSTGPEMGYTHWGQQVCFLLESIEYTAGEEIRGTFGMQRSKGNNRLYQILLELLQKSTSSSISGEIEADESNNIIVRSVYELL